MLLISYIVKKITQKYMPSRQEGTPYLKYLTEDDFSDWKSEPFSFKRNKLVLRGRKYWCVDKPKAILIFFHGMGNGHYSYTTEIHSFAKQGYLVYAYDNAYCGKSDGKGFWSLSSSLLDQKAFFAYLDEQEDLKDLPRYSVGHSWGGFTALCSLQEQYKVEKVISISGFDNVVHAYITMIPDLKKHQKIMRIAQRRYFGKLGVIDAKDLLDKTDKKVLFISGDEDKTVSYTEMFLKLKERYQEKKNFSFLVSPGRAHQAYMSMSAQNYYTDLMNRGVMEGKLVNEELSIPRLTEEDQDVMNAMYKFLED